MEKNILNIRWIKIIGLALVTAFSTQPISAQKLKYKDSKLPVQVRLSDLMGRMTLEEKVAQMCQYVGPDHIRETQKKFKKRNLQMNDDAHGFYKDLSINDLLKLTREGMVGSFLHVVTAEESNFLQKQAMKSRLQIPLIIGIDAIHGNALVSGTTVYPTPIGQASSFNLDLVKEISVEAAKEIRALGAQWTFTPNIDVARDPRWGRIGETYGEDPYLVTRMGVATIKGLQGKGFSSSENVIACGKHLIAGSEPSNGTNAAPMDVSERTLREVYLPPYKAAIEEANVFSLMTAHNELNGIPCHNSNWLMTQLMRNEYGFKGFIVSDWMDVERIYDLHHAAESMDDAFAQSVANGLDMHMHGPKFLESIVKMVRAGLLSEKYVDRACAKILEAKFRLGLFENPFANEKLAKKVVFCKKHRENAIKLAEQSIVLLENDGLLPLDASKFKNILVTGPNANNQTILGDWSLLQPDENVVTVLEGLQKVIGKKKINYYNYGDDVRANNASVISGAVKEAKKSDLAIVVVGENPLRYQKSKTCGENIDRMTLTLLGGQQQLVKDIIKTGVPTIVVLVGGRPLAVNWISEHANALVQAWEPGSFGGLALANLLTGKAVPSAKLPVSIPRHAGQVQMIYNHKPSQYFHKYIDGESTPLYSFGYGLSYAKFAYKNLKLDKKEMNRTQTMKVSVKVTNTSAVKATEIVQLYIRDMYSSATRPVKELKDFARVDLRPSESKVVTFNLGVDKLSFFDKDMKYVAENGTFEVMVGTSSQDKDLLKTQFELID